MRLYSSSRSCATKGAKCLQATISGNNSQLPKHVEMKYCKNWGNKKNAQNILKVRKAARRYAENLKLQGMRYNIESPYQLKKSRKAVEYRFPILIKNVIRGLWQP